MWGVAAARGGVLLGDVSVVPGAKKQQRLTAEHAETAEMFRGEKKRPMKPGGPS